MCVSCRVLTANVVIYITASTLQFLYWRGNAFTDRSESRLYPTFLHNIKKQACDITITSLHVSACPKVQPLNQLTDFHKFVNILSQKYTPVP